LKYLLRIASIFFMVIGIYYSLFTLFLIGGITGSGIGDEVLLALLLMSLYPALAVFSFKFSAFLYKREQRMAQKIRGLLFDKKIKNPVFFLRSFRIDNFIIRTEGSVSSIFSIERLYKIILGTTLEKEISQIMRLIGTPITVGSNSNDLEPWGASRIYCTEESWKQQVLKQAQIASAIFILVDDTPSLLWEMNEVPKVAGDNKIIYLFPPPLSLNRKVSLELDSLELTSYQDKLDIIKKNVPYFPDIQYKEIIEKKLVGFMIISGKVKWIDKCKYNTGYFRKINCFILNNVPKKTVAKYQLLRYLYASGVFLVYYLYTGIFIQILNYHIFHVHEPAHGLNFVMYIPLKIMTAGFLVNFFISICYLIKYIYVIVKKEKKEISLFS